MAISHWPLWCVREGQVRIRTYCHHPHPSPPTPPPKNLSQIHVYNAKYDFHHWAIHQLPEKHKPAVSLLNKFVRFTVSPCNHVSAIPVLHYNDVIMGAMASQITSLTIVYWTEYLKAQIKENSKAPRHWPLCGEFTGDRWIPRTKSQ